METDIPLLQGTRLFGGFSETELAELLKQLRPAKRRYKKSETLLLAGAETEEIGILLSGRAQAVKHTRGGAQFTVARMGPRAVFGDVLAGGRSKSPVTITAAAPCTVLLFYYPRLMQVQPRIPELQARLLANLVGEISDKYFALDARLDLLLIKGLRKRMAAYLLAAAGGRENEPFSIPFTRTALADFLGCERSALSREISRMAKDGLFETHGKQFLIPAPQKLRALL